MKNIDLPRAVARRHNPTGFVLVSVLIAVSVIMSYVASFGRHVIVEGRWSQASVFLFESNEVCHAGLTAARQALVSGQELSSGPMPAGDGAADVVVQSSSDTLKQLEVSALGADGLGVRAVVELAYQPVATSAPLDTQQLPQLDPDSLSALLSNGDVQKVDIHGNAQWSGTEFTGVVVLHPGAVLELNDVIILGAVVSAGAMGGATLSAFDESTAPTLVLAGNVRIDATSVLGNLALLMPDGVVTSSSADARLSVHGDVVAHSLELPDAGVLNGNVSSVVPAQLSPGLDRVGRDRKPAGWSTDLDLGGVLQPVSLAFVPPSWSIEQLAPIITYWE